MATVRAAIAFKPVQPGDFRCLPIAGRIGKAIEIGQWLDGDRFQDYDHADIYVGEAVPGATAEHGAFGYTIGAFPGGARRTALGAPPELVPGSYWSSGLINLTEEERIMICAWAKLKISTPYSFLDYGAIAAHMLHIPVPGLRHYIETTKHMICSQLVDAAYTIGAGHKLFDDGRWPGFVKPGDLVDMLEDLRKYKQMLGEIP